MYINIHKKGQIWDWREVSVLNICCSSSEPKISLQHPRKAAHNLSITSVPRGSHASGLCKHLH